jgi:hypothetical protein
LRTREGGGRGREVVPSSGECHPPAPPGGGGGGRSPLCRAPLGPAGARGATTLIREVLKASPPEGGGGGKMPTGGGRNLVVAK